MTTELKSPNVKPAYYNQVYVLLCRDIALEWVHSEGFSEQRDAERERDRLARALGDEVLSIEIKLVRVKIV